MTREEAVEALAKAAVGAGLRTAEGDFVMIAGAPIHRDLMLAAARACWRRGAKYVHLRYYDDRAARDLLDLAPDDSLDQVPSLIGLMFDALCQEPWTSLMILGDEDPAMFEGADPERHTRVTAAQHRAKKRYFDSLSSFSRPWCIVPYPTDAWARLALGSDRAAGEDLWPILLDAMRLSEGSESSVVAHYESLAARAKKLDALRLDSLRFRGPGTDLLIGLSPSSRWAGGVVTAPDGRRFTPNIPTEEVFTTPDFRRTEGRVACTRPVIVLDRIVEGAWLEFREGSVVASGAAKNEESLARFLAIDAGARRLGEVALVDTSSPVWRSGRLFRNGLVDENAACHIALGFGIASAFEGASTMDASGRESAGFNDSLEHDDLMVGSEGLDVVGRTREGGELPIIVKGSFAGF